MKNKKIIEKLKILFKDYKALAKTNKMYNSMDIVELANKDIIKLGKIIKEMENEK